MGGELHDGVVAFEPLTLGREVQQSLAHSQKARAAALHKLR